MANPNPFTPEEESLILTCMANGIPLCCAAHEDDLNEIIKHKRKRALFDAFAHEGLGCTFDFAKHPSIWDVYLENTIAWFDSLELRPKGRKR